MLHIYWKIFYRSLVQIKFRQTWHISHNLWKLLQSWTTTKIKNFKSIQANLVWKALRHFQPFRSNRISFLRFPRDEWIYDSLVHPWRIKCLRFGAPRRSGVLIKFWDSLKSMSFNSSKVYYKIILNLINSCLNENKENAHLHKWKTYQNPFP